jgi:hypothetical protein
MDSCDHTNESMGSTTGRGYLDQMNVHQLLKEDSYKVRVKVKLSLCFN